MVFRNQLLMLPGLGEGGLGGHAGPRKSAVG